MGGSSGSQTIGHKIYLGELLHFCLGPVDELSEVRFAEYTAFLGSITTQSTFEIDEEELFGGEKKEGGVKGFVDFLLGNITQGQNTYLVNTIGDADLPAFRGIAGLVLNKMYLGTNPFLKTVSARMQRVLKQNREGDAQWYIAKAALINPISSQLGLWYEEFDQDFVNTFYWDNSGGYSLTDDSTNTYVRIDDENNPLVFKKNIYIGPYRKFDLRFRIVSTPLDSINGFTVTFTDSNRSFIYRVVPTGSSNAAQSWSVVPPEGMDTSVLYSSGSSFFSGGVLNTWRNISVNYNPPSTVGFSLIGAGGGANHTFTPTTVGGALFVEISVDTGVVLDVDYVRIDPVTVNYSRSDMNPAHILRELHVNEDYGMSIPSGELADSVWQAAADTLFDEEFGLSFLWDREMEVQEFRNEVLRHIDGAIVLNRQTGLLELRLVRNDYSIGSLDTFDYSNIKEILDYKDPDLDSLVNTLTVKFTEPLEDEEDSVTVSDPALYQMQGYEVAETISYPGIMSKELASRVADRDLRTLSYPVKEIKFKAKYSAAGNYHVTDVFILDLPDKKINNVVFRIVEIDYGDGINNDVTIFAVEDIFATDETGTITLPDTEFSPIVTAPAPCPETLAIETPYLLLVKNEGQSAIDSRLSSGADIGFMMVAGTSPGGGVINGSIYVNTGSGYIDSGVFDFCASAELDQDVSIDPTEVTFNIINATANAPEINTLIKINDELMYLTAYSTSSITVKRGVLDTIPQEHSANDIIMFFEGFSESDGVEYSDSETINVKLSPANSQGEVSLAEITADNITFNSRAIRPYPPGNFRVNSNYYPEFISDQVDITISWAHRDRTQQTSGAVYGNTDENIGPETDVEYELRIYDETNTLIRTYSALTGTSQVYDIATELSDSSLNRANFTLRLELESQRDIYTSWQIYNFTFHREITVLDRDLTAPPGGESLGDSYLIASTATGDWASQDGNIATYNGAGWDFTVPATGYRLYVDDESLSIQYNGSAWV